MATTAQAKRAIREVPPRPGFEYLSLDEFGVHLDGYYATVSEEGEAVVWTWDAPSRSYWALDNEPEEDRRFGVDRLEAIVKWLGRKASREIAHGTEVDENSLTDVGYFTWYADDVVLNLDCGDVRHFTLDSLKLLTKALRAMQPTPADFRPERF